MPDYKYIVTADDYGISPYIDDAIERGIQKGFITAVAAFSNLKNQDGEFVADKAARLKERFKDKVSVGLHFTITSGQRVSDPDSPLSRANSRRFRDLLLQPPPDSQAFIEDELWAQIEAYERAKVVLNGIEQPLEIEHFSDHTGIISHTEIGLRALTNVIGTYNRQRQKSVPMRNPMFIGTLVADKGSCLDDSVSSSSRLPIQLANAIREGNERDVIHTRGEIRDIVLRVNDAGIPITNFSTETLLQHPKLTTFLFNRPRTQPAQCIFDQKNYERALEGDPQYTVNRPLRHDVMTVEIIAHVAIRDLNLHSTTDYLSFIHNIREYGGVDEEYVQQGRVNEYRVLKRFFEKYPERLDDLITFSMQGDSGGSPALIASNEG